MVDERREPAPETESDTTAEPPGPSALLRFRQGFVLGIGIAAAALFTAFALANRQFVDFGWLFGASEVQEVGGDRVAGGIPLIVLLVAAFALGAVVGAIVVTLRSRVRRRERGR